MQAHLVAFAAALSILLSCITAPLRAADAKEVTARDGEYRITGPYTHENLSVFLVHGLDRLPGKTYLTLQEAMEQKKVIVHEGPQAIENISDQDVFVQSCDIIKGGCQDRCFPDDFIVQSRSGVLPVEVFCVEAGRSKPRGTEDPKAFSVSTFNGAGRQFKIAAKLKADQNAVWRAVADSQQKLNQSLDAKVESPQSPTSLQLTLENEKVVAATDAYVNALSKAIDGKHDVIGYAYAINGKVSSADVYGNRRLFRKLWPKLLRGSAVEAVAEKPKAAPATQPAAVATAEDVKACIEASLQGRAEGTRRGQRTVLVTHEADSAALFETLDTGADNGYVHRSYVAVSEEDRAAKPAASVRDRQEQQGDQTGQWRRRQ